jgi:hypothetical protein
MARRTKHSDADIIARESDDHHFRNDFVPVHYILPHFYLILGLCFFIALLSFKPSEPYLTEYLLCNKDTSTVYCKGFHDESSCIVDNAPCTWVSDQNRCDILPCSNITSIDIGLCGNDDYNYCQKSSSSSWSAFFISSSSEDVCEDAYCYMHFTEDEVNNEIYPWSTYAYLPFLMILGPFAELYSYRIAILFGILGRVATRILLLFGHSLRQMQLMQVVYALGTAAEDGKHQFLLKPSTAITNVLLDS